METLNAILLRRESQLLVPTAHGRTAKAVIATFNLNLQDLGYTLAPYAVNVLLERDSAVNLKLFKDTITTLKALRGANVTHRPMYPNFPQQVMEASDAELYLNAIVHYMSSWVSDVSGDVNFVWMPKYRKAQREPLEEKVKLTILGVGNEGRLRAISTAIASSNTSLSETDKTDLKTLMNANVFVLPEVIPQKENLAIVGAYVIAETSAFPTIAHHFKTATDVLRLAVALSGGDVSLADRTRFGQYNRKERRILLTLLEKNCGDTLSEDMLRNGERWKRLGEKLHPGEFKKRFPRVFKAFFDIRNDVDVPTFNSKVEKFIRYGQLTRVYELLRERPGEFARRLDHMLRSCKDNQSTARNIISAFAKVADDVSTPVLLQAMAHFKSRNNSTMRVAFPKGSVAKVKALTERTENIPATFTKRIVTTIEHVLDARFAKLEPLGKVYVDPKLSNYLLPFSQRSASKALRTLVRGSRIPFGDGSDTLRFFIHWKNLDSKNEDTEADDVYGSYGDRVDLDLSAMFYDADWKMIEQISYHNLRSSGYKAVHSGDITNAPKGASEFIDLDIPSAISYGARYVIMMVYSFTHTTFADIPECFAGWMLRSELGQRGEIFEAKTVKNKIDLSSESTGSIMPMIIDLAKREVIWCDASIGGGRGMNVYNSEDRVSLIGRAFTELRKPDMYSLLRLHAEARGKLVVSPEDADVVFSVKKGTQFELATIASEYMANAEKKAKTAKA